MKKYRVIYEQNDQVGYIDDYKDFDTEAEAREEMKKLFYNLVESGEHTVDKESVSLAKKEFEESNGVRFSVTVDGGFADILCYYKKIDTGDE